MNGHEASRGLTSTPYGTGGMFCNVDPVDSIGDESTRSISFQPLLETFTGKTISSPTNKCGGAMTPPSLQSIEEKWENSGGSLYLKGLWKLKHIPRLPDNRTLEQSTAHITNVTPSVVSQRLSDVLRMRSIEAVYIDKKAKVKCRTIDGVEFCIRLYLGKKYNDFDPCSIVVEIQHRFGSSYNFYNDVKEILDAAEGKMPRPQHRLQAPNVPTDVDDEGEAVIIDGSPSIAMAAKLFCHGCNDSYDLALNTLATFTNTSAMGLATARGVSMSLLQLEPHHIVVSMLVSLIVDRNNDSGTFRLRSTAMLVVANAFQVLREHDIPHWWNDQLRPALLRDLWMAGSSPFCALQAARILEFCVPVNNMSGNDLVHALLHAWEVGCAKYFALERQAQICLDRLKVVSNLKC